MFFLFVCGCGISLAAEGRLVAWLVFDGAMSAAFIPAVQLAAVLLVWRMRIGATGPRTSDLLSFLDGNAPWLWWWCAMAIAIAFVPPRSIGPWILVIFGSLLVPIMSGVIADARWLRVSRGRTAPQIIVDIALLRLVGWGAGVVWFFGFAIWYGELPKLAWWPR